VDVWVNEAVSYLTVQMILALWELPRVRPRRRSSACEFPVNMTSRPRAGARNGRLGLESWSFSC